MSKITEDYRVLHQIDSTGANNYRIVKVTWVDGKPVSWEPALFDETECLDDLRRNYYLIARGLESPMVKPEQFELTSYART